MGFYDTLSGLAQCPKCLGSQPPQLLVTETYFGPKGQRSFEVGDVLPAVSAQTLNEFRREIAVAIADADYYALATCRQQHDVAVRFEIRAGVVAAMCVLEDQTQAEIHMQQRAEADRLVEPILHAIFAAQREQAGDP